jgi:hypothetical protein
MRAEDERHRHRVLAFARRSMARSELLGDTFYTTLTPTLPHT